jgi:hydrogenase maturation protease
MKGSEVRGPRPKASPKSEVRSPKPKAKSESWARSNMDSAEFSAVPRTADLGPRTSGSAPRTLIVGYGNPLRSDDALGWHASRLLADALAGSDVEVITCHQLTPELAEPLSQCRRAVFIDADAEGKPGEIHRRTVRPQAPASSSFTHTCTPSGLLGSAKQLYGHRAQAIVITVTAQSFEFGDTLSPIVSAALPEVVEMVRKWVGRS